MFWGRKAPTAAVLLVLAYWVLTLIAQVMAGASGAGQFVRADYLAGAWWQLLSAQWVHFGWLHALTNGVGMAVVVMAFQPRVGWPLQCLALAGGYVGVALVIALDPHCAVYAGASGALHGLLAGSVLGLLLQAGRADGSDSHAATGQRVLAAVVLLALCAKLLLQHDRVDTSVANWLGFVTYYPAHEAGAAGGLLAVLLARVLAPQWFGQATPH